MQKNKCERSEESDLTNGEVGKTSQNSSAIGQKPSKDDDQDLPTDNDEDISIQGSTDVDQPPSRNSDAVSLFVATNPERTLSIKIEEMPSTSTGQETWRNIAQASSAGVEKKSTDYEVISVGSSTHSEESEAEVPWINAKDIASIKACHKCPYCSVTFIYRKHLVKHVTTTCISNPDSKNNKETGRYKCGDCGRSYKQAKNLRHHQKHECQQKVTCPDCGKTMLGTHVTERHKQNHCIKRRRMVRKKKRESSPDELFLDDSSLELE